MHACYTLYCISSFQGTSKKSQDTATGSFCCFTSAFTSRYFLQFFRLHSKSEKDFHHKFPFINRFTYPSRISHSGGHRGCPLILQFFSKPPHQNQCAPSVKQPMYHFHEMIPRKTTNLAKILEKYV